MSGAVKLPDTIQTIPETLAFWAAQTPDAPAFIIPSQPATTYATLWHDARTLAESLHRSGIGRHDRVVLLLPEGPLLATAMLGTMCAAIAVPLPATLTAAELNVGLHDLHAAAALVTTAIAATARDCLAQSGIVVFELDEGSGPRSFERLGPGSRQATRLTWPRPEELAFVCQTSGTTGKPKRVPRTHGSVVQLGKLQRDQFSLMPADRTPVVAPVALSLGQTVLTQAIAIGTALIYPPVTDLAQQWAFIERERPTWLSAAAGFLELLVRSLDERPEQSEPASLRFVLVTSAAISPVICDRLERHLGAPVYPRYSSSEAGAISAALPPPAPRSKPGSVGLPVQEVRIIDMEGNAAGPNSEGEIVVRGPRVFAGYLDDPEANAAAFLPGGWFRTGDVGYFDNDGFLFLTGRIDEVINRGGQKIAPQDVDDALLAHPAVRAAAAFAVPDERLGQDIVAAVVLERGQTATPRELRQWLLDRLSTHKAPRRIWFIDALPVTLNGKVQRSVLVDRFTNDQR